MSSSAPCMWMRGGTSKGAFFLAKDLPTDLNERDAFLLRVMGSPDERQIDGMGGADPLTSKVAVVKPSQQPGADVDYLFLQVYVDQALVSAAQNCGNMLAGVAPFAIERGLVTPQGDETSVAIYMENTLQIAVATVKTPNGAVVYEGTAEIDGVPGTAAPVLLEFQDVAGSSCGSLLPTGNARDLIDGTWVTCIDNGMPTVLLRATDFGISGQESREELDGNSALKARLEAIRLQVGYLMNLDDVTDKTVPKMTLISPALQGGAVATRTFIPHRCHASIGVLGAVSVATACAIPGSIATDFATVSDDRRLIIDVEHPIGKTSVVLNRDAAGNMKGAGILRTARKLFDGTVFA